MTQALLKFKLMEKQTEDPAPSVNSAVKPQRKKLPDLYQHIASKFENQEEFRKKRALEAKRHKEEQKKLKEEEEQRKKEEKERIKHEKEEKERKRREEEERQKLEEETKKLEKEAEDKRIEMERQKLEEEQRLRQQLSAKSMYEQALQKGVGKVNSSEKVVTLRKGTINDIRNKIFEKREVESTQIKKKTIPKKLIIPDKSGPKGLEKNESKLQNEQNVIPPPSPSIEEAPKKETTKTNDIVISSQPLNEENEISKPKTKRQSFINDFAALEKTYRILGIHKEPIVEVEETSSRKKHASEGKPKKKSNTKLNIKQEANEKNDSNPNSPKIKIDAIDKGLNEAKRTFFQTMINEKKGATKEEPILNGPKLRKKNELASAFESKAKESNKRHSLVKEDIKVDAQVFSQFLNKFESEDQRAEAKVKIAQLTAQQKKFEERKRVLQEELNKRKEEEESMTKAIQRQMEEELQNENKKDDQELQYKSVETEKQEFSEMELVAPEKKGKKVKKKKKVDTSQGNEELPQLKIGMIDFQDHKSKFENLRKNQDISPEVKQVKVNKLQINPFMQLNNAEDKRNIKEGSIKVNKLAKNIFIQQLEISGEENKRPLPKKKTSEDIKRNQPEIKFESKKNSVNQKEEQPVESSNLKPIVRGSKSIENTQPSKKEKKNSSTLSLLIDNTKQFFQHSKERLFRLSKEALNELDHLTIEQINPSKPTTSEMQNYLLSHVLFDKTEMQKNGRNEKKLTKEEEFNLYLDKEYKEKIEQYCSLVEESKPRKNKSKPKKKEEKLPQLNLVQVKTIQEQLQSQVAKPVEKRLVIDELENLGTSRVREMQELLKTETEVRSKMERQSSKGSKVNSSIIEKIKMLEKVEKERIKREKENEERIKKLLEQEYKREKERKVKYLDAHSIVDSNETDDIDLKKDIWLRLEEEIDNLEEEQKELETTEQLLLEEEEKARNEALEKDNNAVDDRQELQEMKVEINARKKNADERKKVLQRFQHIFEKDDEKEEKSDIKVGSIHEKIESFLQYSGNENKKKFEDNVLSGVSEIMLKVKNKFESNLSEETSTTCKVEVKRKLNPTALKFEINNKDSCVELAIPKQEKEWSWKSKTVQNFEFENMSMKYTAEQDRQEKRQKKIASQNLKFEELLGDINAVKQRMKDRNINKENEDKMEEMNKFMDEIKNSLKEIEQIEVDNFKVEREETEIKQKFRKTKNQSEESVQEKMSKSDLIQNLKKELFSEQQAEKTSRTNMEMEEYNVSVNSIKLKIIENDNADHCFRADINVPKITSGLVNKLTEMLVSDDKQENNQLTKAPKLLLRNTSLETDEDRPTKTLEDLKKEQQNKIWAWKEKDMKELQNYIKSYNDIVPKTLKEQQKNLQDLEDELDIVESLIDNKETAIIIQIREEKEKEFNNFMDGVKSYMNQETRSGEEDDFKKGMQSYLDLIDNTTKLNVKTFNIPQLKTKTVDKLKSQLLSDNQKSTEIKFNPNVSKLLPSKITAVTITNQTETKEASPVEIQINQTALAKSFFESQKEVSSPIVKSKGIHPAVLNLKNSNKNESNRSLLSQLQHKLKTVLEAHQYIEAHEDLCVPTLIESIHKFGIAKKEEDKLLMYNKFLSIAHSFAEQKGRSEEQKIFKENILAYLKVIENPDIEINGTPKLKKHTNIGAMTSTNIKKTQIEQSNDKVTMDKYLSPEEQRKSILQKYGLKDHIKVTHISDDSDDSSDENSIEEIKELSDNELCSKYGLPQIHIPEDNSNKNILSSSADGLRNILSKIRQVSSEISEESSLSPQMLRKKEKESIPKSGSAARIKEVFELKQNEIKSPSVARKFEPNIVNKGISEQFKKRFENPEMSPELTRRFGSFGIQKSSTVSNIGFFNENDDRLKAHNSSDNKKDTVKEEKILSIEKSRSFSKFKNAFESGVGLNDDEDTEMDFEQKRVKAELGALKSSNKIQNMFRINHSKSDADKNPRLERLLDEKTLHEVSKSRSEITNMFESKAPKLSYGGSKLKLQIEKPKPMNQKKNDSSDSKKWVFDTIQKYFDVIVEEEQNEEEEIEEIENISENEDDDESDYTSAEDEPLQQTPVQVPSKVCVKNKIDISSYFQKQKTTMSVPSTPKPQPPHRKLSIDDFVNNAAKQFDELTDGSNMSLNVVESCQNLHPLSKSNSSSKIRGLFSSVVHGSANDLNISKFKSNLLKHLNSKKVSLTNDTHNYDPGVCDDSSSEFSEYDD